MATPLTQYQIDKLGNALLYLSNHVGDFSKTKALKLLFLLEEKSIQDTGVPFFGFNFEVWQYGPVVEQIYYDLHDQDIPMLSPYIKRAVANLDEFESNAEFNDDEFSVNDILLMDEIIKFARHRTAGDLVAITHGKDSLWRKTAESHHVLKAFEEKKLTKTDILIDFSSLLEKDNYLKERYEASLDYLEFNKLLKS